MSLIGCDFLGIGSPHWPLKKSIELFPNGWALGVFADNTFGGPVMPKVRKFLESGKVAAVRLHAHWSYQHNIVGMNKLKTLLPSFQKLATDFPNVKVYASHSCEHNSQSKPEIMKRMNLIQNLAPSCIPVNSIWKGKVIDGAINERHGGKDLNVGPRWIASTDGSPVTDIDADAWLKRNKDSEIRFLWALRFNLAEQRDEDDDFIPPPNRIAKPSPSYLKSVIRIGLGEGIPPTPMFENVKPVKDPVLWKSFSEDAQDEETPRENRPCFICPINEPEVKMITWNGLSVGNLRKVGDFGPGLWRYYSGVPGGIGLYGAEIGEIAKSKSGHEWIWIAGGGKIFGPCNPAYRTGYYKI